MKKKQTKASKTKATGKKVTKANVGSILRGELLSKGVGQKWMKTHLIII